MQVTKLSWWTSTLMSTLVTLIFIYIIKKATANVNIPVLSDVIKEA